MRYWDNFYIDSKRIKTKKEWIKGILLAGSVKELAQEMPKRMKTAFLNLLEGKTQEEVAEQMGITRLALRTHNDRAINFLKKRVEKAPLYVLQNLLLPIR